MQVLFYLMLCNANIFLPFIGVSIYLYTKQKKEILHKLSDYIANHVAAC